MITDQTEIGRHEVLLPINHKNYNFREKKNSQVMKEKENVFLNYNFECDWLIELSNIKLSYNKLSDNKPSDNKPSDDKLSDNKLSDNNLASELAEN